MLLVSGQPKQKKAVVAAAAILEHLKTGI